jgi:GTPase SAR1 family protein
MYYRGAEAAVVVYDITTSESLNRARDWIQEITCDGDEPLVIALVGNKADLEQMRRISEQDGSQYAIRVCTGTSHVSHRIGFRFARSVGASFFEASAKDNSNIDSIFVDLAMRLIAKKSGGALPKPQVPSGSAIFTGLKRKETSGCCS